MLRILVVLSILVLAACGSAATSVPKTASSPVAQEASAKAAAQNLVNAVGKTVTLSPDGASVDVGEKTVTFRGNALLNFRMTMPKGPWQARFPRPDPNGAIQLQFEQSDPTSMLAFSPVVVEGGGAEALAYMLQAKMVNDGLTDITAVRQESYGRYAFSFDHDVDGGSVRMYIAVVPHPTRKGVCLIFQAGSGTEDSSSFLRQVRNIIDSIAPFP